MVDACGLKSIGDWAFPAQWVGQLVGQSRGPISTVQRIRLRILWYRPGQPKWEFPNHSNFM